MDMGIHYRWRMMIEPEHQDMALKSLRDVMVGPRQLWWRCRRIDTLAKGLGDLGCSFDVDSEGSVVVTGGTNLLFRDERVLVGLAMFVQPGAEASTTVGTSDGLSQHYEFDRGVVNLTMPGIKGSVPLRGFVRGLDA